MVLQRDRRVQTILSLAYMALCMTFLASGTIFVGYLKERCDACETVSECQGNSNCSRYKVLSFSSLVSVYQFFLLESTSLEIIKSDNRSQFSILGILLIFVYVFKLHLFSGIIQRKDALLLFCCFEIRRVDGSYLLKFFKNQRFFWI